MGLGMALIFGLTCAGLAAGGLFVSTADYHRRRCGWTAETVILYILAVGCAVFAACMGWMLLDGLRYASFWF